MNIEDHVSSTIMYRSKRVIVRGGRVWAGLVGALMALGCMIGWGDPEDEPVDPNALDEPAEYACSTFTTGITAARTESDRAKLAAEIKDWADNSGTTGIASTAADLAAVTKLPAEWKAAADAFHAACENAGYITSTVGP